MKTSECQWLSWVLNSHGYTRNETQEMRHKKWEDGKLLLRKRETKSKLIVITDVTWNGIAATSLFLTPTANLCVSRNSSRRRRRRRRYWMSNRSKMRSSDGDIEGTIQQFCARDRGITGYIINNTYSRSGNSLLWVINLHLGWYLIAFLSILFRLRCHFQP